MRVLITGATGFTGRALVPVLRQAGHSVVVWARSEARARARLGAEVEIVRADLNLAALTAAIEGCDAVVNLAGEPIVGRRWTKRWRQLLADSRVALTEQLASAIAGARRRPRVLVSGSAVGYYGDRGDEVLSEDAVPSDDYLARLCRDWEAAAERVGSLGVRVVILRTGVVLGRDGGALAKMLPAFRLGLGGPLGSGRQYVPWIHIRDFVQIVATALADGRYGGPINVVAPRPVTSREFAKGLGRSLRRPAVMPLPAAALRALFGDAASVLLNSQRCDPQALRRLGFPYAFETLNAALADIVGGAPVTIVPRADRTGARPVAYELRTTTTVNAPLEETFAFFSRAENLGMLTPASMRFSIAGRAPAIAEGATIDYTMRIGPLPITWRSRIVSWAPHVRFIDVQETGPYRTWRHEHTFRASGLTTVMEDRVCYAPPLGPLGRLANQLFIVPALRRIFQYRADVIRLRFGATAGDTRSLRHG
jgi:uncharacterized protein (TIGR01777 family)